MSRFPGPTSEAAMPDMPGAAGGFLPMPEHFRLFFNKKSDKGPFRCHIDDAFVIDRAIIPYFMPLVKAFTNKKPAAEHVQRGTMQRPRAGRTGAGPGSVRACGESLSVFGARLVLPDSFGENPVRCFFLRRAISVPPRRPAALGVSADRFKKRYLRHSDGIY